MGMEAQSQTGSRNPPTTAANMPITGDLGNRRSTASVGTNTCIAEDKSTPINKEGHGLEQDAQKHVHRGIEVYAKTAEHRGAHEVAQRQHQHQHAERGDRIAAVLTDRAANARRIIGGDTPVCPAEWG